MDRGTSAAVGWFASSGRRSRWALASVALATAVAMIAAGRAMRPDIVTAAAIVFALAVIAVALVYCRDALRGPASDSEIPTAVAVALLHGAWLTTICYVWGAVAMRGLYLTTFTGLKWQHGWQYASAMALLAIASVAVARALARVARSGAVSGHEAPLRWAMPLAAAQACVAGVGLAALAVSGKLLSTRADWAANRVFAGLAVAILAVSLASILVQQRFRSVLEAI